MRKELEALEHIYYGSQGYGETDRYYKFLKQYLESIDNVNPSEALECLENYINNIIFSKDLISQKQQLLTNIAAIKQSLLKAEEEHNSVNLLMKELACKDFAELRKYARCGYESLNKE